MNTSQNIGPYPVIMVGQEEWDKLGGSSTPRTAAPKHIGMFGYVPEAELPKCEVVTEEDLAKLGLELRIPTDADNHLENEDAYDAGF